MKVSLEMKPVSAYPIPGYPTKQQVMRNPAVLRSVPDRWNAKPAVCLALMLSLSTGLYGCGGAAPASLPTGETLSVSGSAEPSPAGRTPAALSIPVFVHGNGRGSYGCSSVAPPVFLSEEEAAQVIREEAKAAGVDFSGSKSLEGTFPATNLYRDEKFKDATWDGKLELDGYDPSLGIGFEFVSQGDVAAWQQKGNMMSSVEEYDMKGTAERLAGSAENLAVFYDPGEDWQDFKFDLSSGGKDYAAYTDKFSAEQKERMLEDLRSQVCDFLSWLKAEGVI